MLCLTSAGSRVYGHCNEDVKLSTRAQNIQDAKATFLLNKPLKYFSSPPSEERRLHGGRRERKGGQTTGLCAINLLIKDRGWPVSKLDPSKFKQLSPAGRLDSDSTGLIAYSQVLRQFEMIIHWII